MKLTIIKRKEPDRENSAKSQWTTSHIPVCVSIASNVEGYREPRCIVDEDSDNLVKRMCDYLEEIQSRASELSKIHWKTVRDTLQELRNEFPTVDVTSESMDKHNSTQPEQLLTQQQHHQQQQQHHHASE